MPENKINTDNQVQTMENWKRLTANAINKVAQFFKPKEVLTLFDFLETVTKEDLNG